VTAGAVLGGGRWGLQAASLDYEQDRQGGKSREYTGFRRNSSGLYVQNCETRGRCG
jgi:hypothetical protein